MNEANMYLVDACIDQLGGMEKVFLSNNNQKHIT